MTLTSIEAFERLLRFFTLMAYVAGARPSTVLFTH